MSRPNKLAFIGNSLPRHCGIATFTTDLQQAVESAIPAIQTAITAMNEDGRQYEYPSSVVFQIGESNISDYRAAAEFLNAERFEVVSLQHEFGIFGGEDGSHVLELLSRLEMPVVTTFHTVLENPSPGQREVMARILELSSKAIVMSLKGRAFLQSVFRCPLEKIEIIPHGIPDFEFVEPDRAKHALGFAGKTVILTFGLLSPNKGVEFVIEAMPSILRKCENAIYVILGATHPNLVRQHGEAYRQTLIDLAETLGVTNHVAFLDQFVDKSKLLEFISMCDVYVTPYLNEAQMTSGTLAYSFGLGKAVVSTPYWHAKELLADGRGILVPFGDSAAMGREIATLLIDDARRQTMREIAYASSRSMIWEVAAQNYMAVFASAVSRDGLRVVSRSDKQTKAHKFGSLPEMRTSHFLSMCDDTGLFQHAVHSVPNRVHGYCIDDNARALILACRLGKSQEQVLPDTVISTFAAFLQHAWNPATKRFRNFMSFERAWLEDVGSEDSHGRALWALGECASNDTDPRRRRWAQALFCEALPSVEAFTSPRAWAFTLLGLHANKDVIPVDPSSTRIRVLLAERLFAILSAVESKDWVWFEDSLSYDNARLAQALIVTGMSTSNCAHVDGGLRALSWLAGVQTAPAGHFRPVGTEGFGEVRSRPRMFDQQPLEAAAMTSACLAVFQANGALEWKIEAIRAFNWFFGANDLSTPLVNLDTGSCRDGLHSDRANENCGGESVVSYLISLTEIRQLERTSEDQFNPSALLRTAS